MNILKNKRTTYNYTQTSKKILINLNAYDLYLLYFGSISDSVDCNQTSNI